MAIERVGALPRECAPVPGTEAVECPECALPLSRTEGCAVCRACGYATCG